MSAFASRDYAVHAETVVPHTNSAGLFYQGDSGQNTQAGTAGDDGFDYSQGGNDTLSGLGGDDEFYMGAAFGAADRIDGGAGTDTLFLDGNYYNGANYLQFTNETLVSVEKLVLAAGNIYNLQFAPDTIAQDSFMVVDASVLARADSAGIHADASAGSIVMYGGSGNDQLYSSRSLAQFNGGGGDDLLLDQSEGGAFYGGAGADDFFWNVDLAFSTRNQVFDGGGGGFDALTIEGFDFDNYTLSYPVLSIAGFEQLTFDLKTTFTLSGSMLPARGKTLAITADEDVTLYADSARGNITFHTYPLAHATFYSGRGDDNLYGGDGGDILVASNGQDTLHGWEGDDILQGGAGADQLDGGADHDTFIYAGVRDSTGTAFDTVTGFAAQEDVFQLNGMTVADVASALEGGTLDTARFNHDLKIAVGASALPSHFAVLYTPDDGDLAGHTFLIVDANGTAGYQANQDYVIELSDGANLDQLSTDNF